MTITRLSAKAKLTIASKDSFDYPLVLLAGAFAGLGQVTDQNPSFGQGMAGYGRRIGTGYADQAIGNMMTEGFFPVMLHQDPRYFRMGEGSKKSRTMYALTRVFVTYSDSGKKSRNSINLSCSKSARKRIPRRTVSWTLPLNC